MYEEPYTGLGNYYSGLADGIRTVLWNPAGLLRQATGEASVTLPFKTGNYSFGKTLKVSDTDFTSGAGNLKTTLFFTKDTTDLTKQQRNINSSILYTGSNANVLLDKSIRINDFMVFGIKTMNPIEINASFGGEIPAVAQYTADFMNYSSGKIATDSEGKISYAYSGTSTYVSDRPLWSGFLTQKLNLPTTTISSMNNRLKIDEPFVMSGAIQINKLLIGANVIPINARAEIDNRSRVMVNKSATDMVFYTPDFDANDQAAAFAWTQDPELYGTSKGYKMNTISVPAGEVIVDSSYSGVYTGSTLRTDIGAMWLVDDNSNLGFVIENASNSSLNMKGSGLSYYANHRLNTANQPSVDPQSGFSWSPFTAGASDFVFASGKGLYMEPVKEYKLPRKLRMGAAFRNPFILTVDYEMPDTPVTIMITDGSGNPKLVTISGMNVLRIGTEMQILNLPAWFRGGIGFVYKPVADDADVQAKIDSLFKFRSRSLFMFPFKIDGSLQTKIMGNDSGIALGIDPLAIINAYALDVTYSNFGKPFFLSLYTKKDSWNFSYSAVADPIATVASVQSQNRAVTDITFADLKWNQALSVSYKF